MPPIEAALKPLQEGEQTPLAIAPSTKMLPGAGETLRSMTVDAKLLNFVEQMIIGDVEQALANLNTEEEGKTEKQRIYQRYCKHISFVSKETLDRVNSLPQQLYKKEMERMKQRQWLVNNGQVSENHYDSLGLSPEQIEKLKKLLNTI